MEFRDDSSVETLQRITGFDQELLQTREEKIIRKAYEAVRTLNELRREGLDASEIDIIADELVEELDSECPHYNMPIMVKGIIQRPISVLRRDGEETQEYAVVSIEEPIEAISRGFAITSADQGEYSIGYMFDIVNDRVDSATGTHRQIRIAQGYANLSDVTILYRHDFDDARAALHNFAGELLQEIDESVYNSTSLIESFHALAEVKPIEMYGNGIDPDLMADALVYTSKVLDIDNEVPYVIEFKDTYLEHLSDNEYFPWYADYSNPENGSRRILGYIEELIYTADRNIVNSVIEYEDVGLYFAVTIRVVHDEKQGGPTNRTISVLMKDFLSCESTRDLM